MENEKATTKTTDVYVTSKMNVTAWLQIHQVKVVNVRRMADNRLEYTFENEGGQCNKLYTEWLNSKCCMFDNRIRELKRQYKRPPNGKLREQG